MNSNSLDNTPAARDSHGLPERELSYAPGFGCPSCGFRIRMSLADFLFSQKLVCPGCGLEFGIDKSECTRMVEHLQEIHNADETAQKLRRQVL